MINHKAQIRLDELFADLTRLRKIAETSEDDSLRRELDALQARFSKLEAHVRRSEAQEEPPPQAIAETPSAPLLYQAERIGYVFSQGQVEKLKPGNPLARDGGDLIETPLVASGRTIGGMLVEPAPDRAWTEDEINLLNTVAQRASQQLENLRLLTEAERARAQAEAASRRFMHESWDSYLDAIQHSERVGYAYDQESVTPCLDKASLDGGFQQTVSVLDEQVGDLYIEPDPTRPLTGNDKDMIAAIAHQIAQQVENIRLLADASRARAEAEEATRRLTRENWDAYNAQNPEALGFIYDSNRVLPLRDESRPQALDLIQPLIVRGEVIGELAAAGVKNEAPDMKDLVAAIAERASIHLETLRLTEELQQRARELQELDRLKSAFLANMSHELRTPLNSILGFADVMLEELDGPLTENMNNDLKLIQKNGQHLLHLINDVLDMAKIEAGRMNLAPEEFAVQEVLGEVVSITSTLASEKNLALFIEPDSDAEVQIFADRTRLRQVMINLVNNAIKFTEKGKISIRAARQDGEKVLITVKDTGIGVPPDKLETIFQEFAQIDTSTTRKAGGTGLGLPISRRLVEMHGGQLWAESTGVPGEGSSFFVELPLKARIVEPIEKLEK